MSAARITPQKGEASASNTKLVADQNQAAKGTSSKVIFRSLTTGEEWFLLLLMQKTNSNIEKRKLHAKPCMTLLQQFKILIKQQNNIIKLKSFLKAHGNNLAILIAIDTLLPKLESSHPVKALLSSFKTYLANKQAEKYLNELKVELDDEKSKTPIKTEDATDDIMELDDAPLGKYAGCNVM